MVNERQLAMHEFIGVIRNTIKIRPPPKTRGENDFRLTILKRNVWRTILDGLNPYEKLVQEVLLDTKITYGDHGLYKKKCFIVKYNYFSLF